MKNKIEFSADGRDICRFLTVVFILTLIIGIATAYGYYIGSNIRVAGYVMMLIPALSVILTVKWDKTKVYPKKIFDYGVSSTGGSGIGLYHVQWLCTSYKGDIQVHPLASGGLYTKCFTITLPL